MILTTFGDLINLTKARCNIATTDTTYDDILINGMNEAYNELGKLDPQVTTAIIPCVNNTITLPDDLDAIMLMDPSLPPEIVKRGKTILVDSDLTYTITYAKVLDPLNATTDVPVISKKYWYLLTTYGAYSYYLFKKKDEANTFLAEYMNAVERLKGSDTGVNHTIQNVYSYLTWGEW